MSATICGMLIRVSETHVPAPHVKLPAGDPDSSTATPAIPTCASYSRTTWCSLLPSKIVFSQQQAMEDDRSPTYNLLMEVRRELTELRSEVARCDNRIAYATPHQGHYLKIFDHHSFLSIARLATPTITESESFDVSVGSCGHQRDAHPQNPSDRATSGYQYSGALQAAKLMEWTHR